MFLTFPWTWIKWMIQRIGWVRVSPWKTNGFEGYLNFKNPPFNPHFNEALSRAWAHSIPWRTADPMKNNLTKQITISTNNRHEINHQISPCCAQVASLFLKLRSWPRNAATMATLGMSHVNFEDTETEDEAAPPATSRWRPSAWRVHGALILAQVAWLDLSCLYIVISFILLYNMFISIYKYMFSW
jgi:hypothetical protein